MEWNVGLKNFKKCSLEQGENSNHFTTELLDVEFDHNRDIADIFYDHLAIRQTKFVEILYSGGLDSELILLSCLRKNIPIKVITMIIKVNDMILNTHDLYYAEKFCREHNVEQTIVELDAVDFYESGKYYDYVAPYQITQPNVASHMWLLEQCSHFPVIGGDWPWVQMHKENKVLSPFKIDFSSYERFMQDKGVHGIGNMISYSLESSYKMMELHMQCYAGQENIAPFKQRMYTKIEPNIEPRLKSHGWENNIDFNSLQPIKNLYGWENNITFNLMKSRKKLFENIKPITDSIKWGKTISELLNTPLRENNLFK